MVQNSDFINYKLKSWTEIQDYLKISDMIIIPIGAIEQHGPSCPVFTDSIIAEYLSLRLGVENNILVAPTIPIGDSLIHLGFPGTISLKPTTMIHVIKDYIESLYITGFRRFLVVNGHGDNNPCIWAAFSELGHELTNLRYNFKDFWDFPNFRETMQKEFGDPFGGHADASDASIMLAINSKLVNTARFSSNYAKIKYWISRDLVHQLYTTSGVINSDQGLATQSIGIQLIEESLKGYSEILLELKK